MQDSVAWPALYEVRVQGRLNGERWSQWFAGMTLTATESGETVLRGRFEDQAALYGLLARLRDLALPLLSVNRVKGAPGPQALLVLGAGCAILY